MVVVNIVGFPYKLRLRSGIEIVIPYDNLPHEVPDEIAENKFDNVFKILVPPRTKTIAPIGPVVTTITTTSKVAEIIEIDLVDSPKVEDNIKVDVTPVEELKEEKKVLPLKGIKIKARDKLIKKGKPRNKKIAVLDTPKIEETNNGNN